MKDSLYHRIALTFEEQIRSGTLKKGQKMPSLRLVHKEHGVSLNTVLQAYYELEAKGLIVSRPKSGYYVSFSLPGLSIPSVSQPVWQCPSESVESLISRVYASLNAEGITRFSLGVPDNQLLPIARLNKAMLEAMRNLKGSGTEYEDIQGNRKLREAVARMTYAWNGKLTGEDIVTTSGTMGALSFAFQSVVEKGDTVAVESPVYFGILQLARSLGLQVIELPTHPLTGIDPDALRRVLPQIDACILVGNFNNPLGSCMPDEHKREIVHMLSERGIPLIEDDIYGDLYFGSSRPRPCKYYDTENLVLWCGSVSKTLAPGYRVGWIAPGKYKDSVIHQKLIHTVSTTTLTQEAVAGFLEKGRYEHHLRKLRNELHANSLHFSRAIEAYFPEGTRISRPQGGFMMWVELPRVDTTELYDQAIRRNISIAPGRMFSLQNQFVNCMRLSFGQRWSDEVEDRLQLLGKVAKNLMS